VIEKILTHLGSPPRAPQRAPAHGQTSLRAARVRESHDSSLGPAPGAIPPLAPLPQGLATAGLGYVIANAAPAPGLQAPIFAALAAVLGTVAVIDVLRMVLAMRQPLFRPEGPPRE